MYDAELKQLIAMGVGKSQGRAALEVTKGDVSEACNRIFGGEFEDIVDSEEDEMQLDEEREDDEGDEDDEGAYPFSDEDGDDYYEMGDADHIVNGTAATSDPYAGIFFSKSRVEEVIEITEPTINGNLLLPAPADQGGPPSKREYEVLTQGKWMKGCPEGNEQSFLFQLYFELTEGTMRCQGPASGERCEHEFERDKKDFFAVLPTVEDTLAHVRHTVRRRCPACRTLSCLACGDRIDENDKGKKRMVARQLEEGVVDEASEWPELFHCSNIQGVLVGVGLHTIEKFFESSSTPPSTSSKPAAKVPAKRKAKSFGIFGSDEDGDANVSRKGTGYSGSATEDTTGQVAAKAAQKKKDGELQEMLKVVRVFLPDHDRKGGSLTSDAMPHPATLAHLRRRFNAVATALLKNDSLSDQSDRSSLYMELIQWLLTVSRHDALASLLAMPHMRIASTTAKTTLSGQVESVVRYEGTDSPREMLENIVIQCKSLLKGVKPVLKAKKVEGPQWKPSEKKEEQTRLDEDPEEKAEKRSIVQYCERIVATASAIDRALTETKGEAFMKKLKESLPRIPEKGDKTAESVEVGKTEEETKRIYIDWATRTRFEYVDLSIGDGTAYNHIFSSNIVEVEGAMPKRSLVIAKELAVMTVNLPVSWESSVFLRVDESRQDCIKVLIVGPEDTPYANGCFIFDVFLPYNYNTGPPMCKIVTTNGGRFRFNPNLYAEGKVCLSLLGTWAGPSWIPGRSTLLQVLISIQSLILVEHPMGNEPGFENQEGTSSDLAYNANIRRMTVHEMISAIQNPVAPFKDVIHTHFKLKASSLRVQLDKWETTDDGRAVQGESHGIENQPTGSGSGFKADLKKLRGLLNKLEKGEVV